MAAGRGRAVRGRGGGQGGKVVRIVLLLLLIPPPPPPPPPDCPPTPPDDGAALANIADSPATRTRRQLMLALHSGSNSTADGGGCGGLGGRGGQDDQGGGGANEGSGVAGIVDNSPARRTRQRSAEASHAGTGTAQLMMQQLYANTDESEEEDNYEDNDPPYAEPVNVSAAAANKQVLQEEVQYVSTRMCERGSLSQNEVCKFEWQSRF